MIQDFSVSPNTGSETVTAGQTTAPYQFTIAPNPLGSSFNAAVAVSCTGGLPAGAQCLFSPPTPLTLGSSAADLVMSISTGASTSSGTYSVTVTGTSGLLSRSKTVSLTVTNPVGSSNDFQVAATQAFPAGIAAGAQTQAKVSVTANYGGSVNAHCDASVISGQCLITPINPVAISTNVPASLALTLNVPNSITPGTYNINLTIADSAGQPSHTLLLPLTVIPDFSVTSATPSQTLAAGQTTSGAYQLTVAPRPVGSSFAGVVTLSCPSGLPASAMPICPVRPAYTRQYLGGRGNDYLHLDTQSCSSIPSQSLDLLRAVVAVARNRDRLECDEHWVSKAQGPRVRRYDPASADLVFAFLWRR